MNLSELAYKAADIMSERGLAKGIRESRDGVCFWGAVATAMYGESFAAWAGKDSAVYHVINDAATLVLRERGLPSCDAVTWNDAPRTTKEDIVSLLRETGKALEGIWTRQE